MKREAWERCIHPYCVGVTFCRWLWNSTVEEHWHTYAHAQDWHTSTLHTNALIWGGDGMGTHVTHAHKHTRTHTHTLLSHRQRCFRDESGSPEVVPVFQRETEGKTNKIYIRNSEITQMFQSQNSLVLWVAPTAEMTKSTRSKKQPAARFEEISQSKQ